MNWLAITLDAERLLLGAFFVTSAWRKFVRPDTRGKFQSLFVRLGLPRYWVSIALAELVGGTWLCVGGIATVMGSIALICVLLGAIYLDVWAKDVVGKDPSGLSGYFVTLVCTPEVLMIVMLLGIIAMEVGLCGLCGTGLISQSSASSFWL